MAEKYYYQNPKISDTVVFDLYTPDANCCFFADPFSVVSITISFVERNFVNDYSGFTSKKIIDIDLEKEYLESKQKVCDFPDNKDYMMKLNVIEKNYLKVRHLSLIKFNLTIL